MDGSLQAFDAWMNGSGPLVVLAGIAVLWVTGPLFALVHELGHALVGLGWSHAPVHLIVGRQPGRWRFRVGRLACSLSPTMPWGSEPGGATMTVGLGRGARIASALAGPLAHAALSILVVFVGHWTHHDLLVVVGVLATLWSALSFVPKEAGSDGATLIAALRREDHAPRNPRSTS